MRPRFSLTLGFGLLIGSGIASAQTDPAVSPVPVLEGEIQPICDGCKTMPKSIADLRDNHDGDRRRPYGLREKLALKDWMWSNAGCENCGTCCSELDFIFGSCGYFYCGEMKRDLFYRVPLAAAGYIPAPPPPPAAYPTPPNIDMPYYQRPPLPPPGTIYHIIPIETGVPTVSVPGQSPVSIQAVEFKVDTLKR
jgi:hypothetical protein